MNMITIGGFVKAKSLKWKTLKHKNKTSMRLIFDKFLSIKVKKKKERMNIYISVLILLEY